MVNDITIIPQRAHVICVNCSIFFFFEVNVSSMMFIGSAMANVEIYDVTLTTNSFVVKLTGNKYIT